MTRKELQAIKRPKTGLDYSLKHVDEQYDRIWIGMQVARGKVVKLGDLLDCFRAYLEKRPKQVVK